MTRLTFQNGKFILPDGTSTTNLKAAVKFRQYSDDKAKRIFDRALSKRYNAPLMPQLSFLDPHQKEGIEWILTRKRSYLAHAPGAGKTCQAIVAAHMIPLPGPIVYIVPPTLTMNWQREVLAFSKRLGIYPTVAVVPRSSGQTTMKWNADFIIVPDSMLTKPWVYKRLVKLKPKLVAVDEASRFKEPTAQRSKAFYGGQHEKTIYPGLFYNSPYTVFLDGSPMPNRAIELWAPCYYLDPAAIDYLDYSSFGYRYGGATLNERGQWEFKGSSHEDELRQKLQKSFMHVVPESKLGHPERLRSMVFMTEDPRTTEMKSWEKKNLSKFELDDVEDSELARYLKKLGLSKVQWSARYIRERLENKSESILVFAWHREVCEKLAQELKQFNPFIVYGGVKDSEREKAFGEFQNGKRRIIIGNTLSMGRGHNLQKATRVVHTEYFWNDEVNKQAEKRTSRRGNDRAFVKCDYIVIPDSGDEMKLKSIFTNEARVKRVIGC